MKIKILAMLSVALLFLSVEAKSSERIFCSVATAWKGAIVYEWDTHRYTQSFDDCLCMAQEEVLGNRFEDHIGKVRVMMSISGRNEILTKVFSIPQLKKIKACF